MHIYHLLDGTTIERLVYLYYFHSGVSNINSYSYKKGVEELTKGQRTFSAPLDYIPLHLRGGTVIPIQFPDGCLNTVCRYIVILLNLINE